MSFDDRRSQIQTDALRRSVVALGVDELADLLILLGGTVDSVPRQAAPTLVAAVVLDDRITITESEIRRFLLERLPTAHMPSRIKVVDSLARTGSGKRDWNAIQDSAFRDENDGCASGGRPQSRTERWLALLWGNVLDLPITNPTAHFFDSGGGSLDAMRATARMSATLGEKISLKLLFANPVLQDCASALDELGARIPDFERRVDAGSELVRDSEPRNH